MTPRELLLGAALRRLVAAEDAIESLPAPSHLAFGFDELQDALEDALAAARAALTATDVRGALVHDWLQPGMDGWQHRGTDDWQCACGAWGSHLWMGWAYHLQAALAAKGVEG